MERRTLPDGTTRFRLSEPVEGWLSPKTSNGDPILERPRMIECLPDNSRSVCGKDSDSVVLADFPPELPVGHFLSHRAYGKALEGFRKQLAVLDARIVGLRDPGRRITR